MPPPRRPRRTKHSNSIMRPKMLSTNSLLSSHFSSSARAAAAGKRCCVRILLYCTEHFPLVLPHCRLVFIYLFISPQPGNFPWQLFFINEEQKILLSGGKCVTAKRYFNWWRECEPYTRWIKLNVSD